MYILAYILTVSCQSENLLNQLIVRAAAPNSYLGDDGVVLPNPQVLWLLLHRVCGRELHSLAVAAQDGLAPAHVGGLQSEAAPVLHRSHRVVSDVT